MSEFTFAPVQITRGRKFKGFGFLLSSEEVPIAYGVSYFRGRIWDPVAKRIQYANADFCEKVEMAEEEIEKARKAYIDLTIQSTIAWCRTQKPSASDNEVLQFARNVLRKHHREMEDEIDKLCPDKRDTVTEVENTLKWALTLRTRPCVMYGKVCKGGKKFSDERYVQIAYKALARRGITKLESFAEAWDLQLTLMGLPKNVDLKNIQA